MNKQQLANEINANVHHIVSSQKRNKYYYSQIKKIVTFNIPPESSVLMVGCKTGDILASTQPKLGVGIDISKKLLQIAKKHHPALHFACFDPDNISLKHKFDYIIIVNLFDLLDDVQLFLTSLQKYSHSNTRIIIIHFNYVWVPFLRLAEFSGLKFKIKEVPRSWIALEDIQNFIRLSDMETIKMNYYLLLPFYLPIISSLINRFIANLPIIRNFNLITLSIARFQPHSFGTPPDYSVSVIIPARNEKGNVESLIARMPDIGSRTELIFVEGNSSDGTYEEMERCINLYKNRFPMRLIAQGTGIGKGDAVRKGFTAASGDILMILDADISVAPEDLPRFYNALRFRIGDFVNGSRLVYSMEEESMRFLNMIGNKFFSWIFSYLLDQRFKDTLCGTKVLFKNDYLKIAANRHFFGDFDPFGDFDLLFGAAKLNLKIVEIPIHYRKRVYGTTNISRFTHGFLLLKMCLFALKKLKFL